MRRARRPEVFAAPLGLDSELLGLDSELLHSTDGEPVACGSCPPAWSTTPFGAGLTAIHATTVKLTDPRWWATEAPERPAQGAAILGVHL